MLEPPPEAILSIGDIVGLGVRTARRKWRFLLQMYMSAAIFYGLGVTAFTWAIGRLPSMLRTSDMSYMSITFALAAIAATSGLVSTSLVAQRTVAVIRMALLEGTTEQSAKKYAQTHQWKAFSIYIGSTLVGILIFVAAFAAFYFSWNNFPRSFVIAAFIFIGALIAAANIWLYQFWALSLAVLSIEETAWGALFSRSYELARNSTFRAISYVFLLGVALYMMNVILNMPLLGFFFLDFLLKTNTITSPEMPVWLRVLDTFLSALRLVILMPCAVLCNAFYYNDLRLRCDGWDLVKRLEVLSQLEKP